MRNDRLVGFDDAGEASSLDRHIGKRRPLVERQAEHARTPELEHASHHLTGLEERLAQEMEHDVLCADARMKLALEQDAHGLGNLYPDIARPPGVRHVGRPHPESEAPEGARHARMTVRACDDLTGKRDLFDDFVVTDRFGADDTAVVEHFAVELDAPARGKVSLHGGGSSFVLHVQTRVAVLLAHHPIDQRQVIPKRVNALRALDAGIGPESSAKQRVGHGRDVFVRKANVGLHEERISGLHRGDTDSVANAVYDRVTSEDLLGQCHRAPSRGDDGRPRCSRNPRLAVRKEPTALDDLSANRVEPSRELCDRSGSLAHSRCAESAPCRCSVEEPDVLGGVLPIDLFEARRDDEPHPPPPGNM